MEDNAWRGERGGLFRRVREKGGRRVEGRTGDSAQHESTEEERVVKTREKEREANRKEKGKREGSESAASGASE